MATTEEKFRHAEEHLQYLYARVRDLEDTVDRLVAVTLFAVPAIVGIGIGLAVVAT